ncbi:CooT family nickel-binding protein [Thermosediminibacter oceani]|uniref:RNA-binding protein, predicted n=1 Tax=Thermosediminibacter oceani (strain ATCC BAA-1034 / DSM 16646 / JW/IW-1228P) TaxID=555079 RepID=D9S1S8_THEOJ|nr:CooT family nickel-binding protein [Thermosediminibacter oceani]ADL07355.1 RNA-binding protein, predicted [Thermosediminibacter oceani DSM 16646]
MCEANVYILKDDREELVLESVDKVIPQEEGILLEDIFGKRKLVRARIKEMALVNHRIILEEIK